jgi:hypothetical protein
MPTVTRIAIKSAEDFHHHDPRWGSSTTAAERIVLQYWKHGDPMMEGSARLPRMVSNKATVYARVDLGRWIVDCPWCKSAQHASREDHRFFCVECGNAAVDGHWVPVSWPNEWAAIEEILSARPDKGNQWWSPGETIASLQYENEIHGVI